MGDPPAILILDDGELDDVQRILESLDTPFARVRGGAIAPSTPPPDTLLITTARRVNAVLAKATRRGGPQQIVVLDEDSNTLREKLRGNGFDYLVRRPVHPEALRLLLLHCLYQGKERRSGMRVPVGFEISFRSGLLPRRATLADLSVAGCRLLSRYALDPGKRVKLEIPQSLGASKHLALRGRVIRTTFDSKLGSDGLYRSAVAFEDLEPATRNELEWVLEERVKGPPSLRSESGDDSSVQWPVLTAALREKGVRIRPDDPRVERVPPEKPAPDDFGSDFSPLESEDDGEVLSLDVPVDVRLDIGDESDDSGIEEFSPEAAPERRQGPRVPYARKVPAFGHRALRVLVGRDLSAGGMRVTTSPGLELGDRMHLAIYGDAKEPFLVWATAFREDGEHGMVLTFDELTPETAAELEKLVAKLPSVEALQDSEADAMGTVLSEVLN